MKNYLYSTLICLAIFGPEAKALTQKEASDISAKALLESQGNDYAKALESVDQQIEQAAKRGDTSVYLVLESLIRKGQQDALIKNLEDRGFLVLKSTVDTVFDSATSTVLLIDWSKNQKDVILIQGS